MRKRNAEMFTRALGRRLIDLTGNGPPTRGERIRQRLRLAPPHPTYTIAGRTFISKHPSAGTLSAHISAPVPSISNDFCLIETITGARPTKTGVDGDFSAVIDCDLLGANETTAWSDISPDQASSRLARIGRQLAYAEFASIENRRMNHKHLLLCDKPKIANLIVYLLEAALVYNGHDDKQVIIEMRTPNAFAELSFEGFSASLSPRLSNLIRNALEPRLKIIYQGESLRICRDRIRIELSDMPITDRMKLAQSAIAMLERSNLSEQDLAFIS